MSPAGKCRYGGVIQRRNRPLGPTLRCCALYLPSPTQQKLFTVHVTMLPDLLSSSFCCLDSWRMGINKLIRKAGSILGAELDPWDLVLERRMLLNLRSIPDKAAHPLHDTLVNLRSAFSN
ncbi:uncharacterized protein LOC144603617 [Rhinoraja longicauda]